MASDGRTDVREKTPNPGGEERLIRRIEALWKDRAVSSVNVAEGDDCAVLRFPGARDDLLLTVDQVVENRHFVRGAHPPAALGRKALVRSLSDIAAMGGRPVWCLQTLILPEWAVGRWHDEFQRGFRAAAADPDAEGLALVGGDVSSGERFAAAVTVVGCVEGGEALLRSGAQPGDLLFVSGRVGGSSLGLARLLEAGAVGPGDPAIERHCRPAARLRLGRELRKLPATSAIDISDGLAVDAGRIARASGVSIEICPRSLPLFPGADTEAALSSGEEYELLCTIPPEIETPEGLSLTRIGRVTDGSGVWLRRRDSVERLAPAGHSHF